MSEITSEKRAVATLSAYVDQLLTDEITDELNTSENKRRVFFAFVFGGVVALAIHEDLTPQEAQSVAIAVYCETLRLSPIDGSQMTQLGIDAAAGDSCCRMRRATGSKSSWRGKLILKRSRYHICALHSIVCWLTVLKRGKRRSRRRTQRFGIPAEYAPEWAPEAVRDHYALIFAWNANTPVPLTIPTTALPKTEFELLTPVEPG